MAQTNINIRMDEQLKKQFDHLCNELGMNMTTAFNIFAKTMVRQQRIPFEVSLETPNAETREAIQEGVMIFPCFLKSSKSWLLEKTSLQKTKIMPLLEIILAAVSVTLLRIGC